MHELSVAESIFSIAAEKIRDYPGKKPVKINLEVGLLAGIDFEALDFAIASVIPHTPFEHSSVEIHKITPLARCTQCNHEFNPDDYIANCPECGNFNIEFIRGKELFIKSIELEDKP